MIAALHRFRGNKALAYLYRHGNVVRVQGLSLKYSPTKRQSGYRAAVVVSKKVHKSAVVRNRIRRRIFEQLRLQLAAVAQFDLAVTVYDDMFASVDAETVRKSVRQLLEKAGLPRD